MNDGLLNDYLKVLSETEVFEGQVALEGLILSDYIKKLSNLAITDKLAMDTAKLLGAIGAIRELQQARKTRVEIPALKGKEKHNV